ncbi:MAG: hypothetical protein LC808_29105, partial [Actinobacteria bacterium]|nr:hypothetical protein [Actinomycetota bacterium]
GDRTDTARVLHQRRAVFLHRLHHRPPAHTELSGQARHGTGVGAYLARLRRPLRETPGEWGFAR